MKYIIAEFKGVPHFFLFPEDVNHSTIFSNLADVDPLRKLISAGKIFFEKTDMHKEQSYILIEPGSHTLNFRPATPALHIGHSVLAFDYIRNGFTLHGRGPRLFYYSSSEEAPYGFKDRSNEMRVDIKLTFLEFNRTPRGVITLDNISNKDPLATRYFEQAFAKII